MYFRRNSSQGFLWKLVNMIVVAVIVLGAIVPATAQAASASLAQPSQTNAGCAVPTAENKAFLPFIASAAQAVATELHAALSDPAAVDRKLKYEVGKTYIYNYNVSVLTKSSSRNSNSA